jgi:hypothetical protein
MCRRSAGRAASADSLGLHDVARGRYTPRDFPFGEPILHHRARRRRIFTRIVPLTWVLAFLAPPSHAARAQDTSVVAGVTEPDLGLRSGNVVHVAALSVGQQEATLVSASGLDLVIRAGGIDHSLRLAPNDSLWVLVNSARRGATVGGIAGLAVAGALLGLYRARCKAGTDDPCTGQSGFVVAAAVFGGTGALMGALVGKFNSHWALRWPGARS